MSVSVEGGNRRWWDEHSRKSSCVVDDRRRGGSWLVWSPSEVGAGLFAMCLSGVRCPVVNGVRVGNPGELWGVVGWRRYFPAGAGLRVVCHQ